MKKKKTLFQSVSYHNRAECSHNNISLLCTVECLFIAAGIVLWPEECRLTINREFLSVICTLSTKYNCNTEVVVFTFVSKLLQVLGMYSIEKYLQPHVCPRFFTIELVFPKDKRSSGSTLGTLLLETMTHLPGFTLRIIIHK